MRLPCRPPQLTLYYRMRQVARDGTTTYSMVRTVQQPGRTRARAVYLVRSGPAGRRLSILPQCLNRTTEETC